MIALSEDLLDLLYVVVSSIYIPSWGEEHCDEE